MLKTNHRAKPQASRASTEHTPASNAASPAARRGALTLRAILDALSWLGELQAMPFVTLEPGVWHDVRRGWDY